METATLVGALLLILGVALGLTSYLVDAEIPSRATDWVRGSIDSKPVFLLLLNIFLLLVGALMDIYSAIVVVVPLIVPIGLAFGVDPIHLGIIFLANLELGYLTPRQLGILFLLRQLQFIAVVSLGFSLPLLLILGYDPVPALNPELAFA